VLKMATKIEKRLAGFPATGASNFATNQHGLIEQDFHLHIPHGTPIPM
jgi:hypothetical protein